VNQELREGVRYRSRSSFVLDALTYLVEGVDLLEVVWIVGIVVVVVVAALLGVPFWAAVIGVIAVSVLAAGAWYATGLRRALVVEPEGVVVRGRLGSRRLSWGAIERFDVSDGVAVAILRDGSVARIKALREHPAEGFREWWLIGALNERLAGTRRAIPGG
jgi:Bacterial PH domain